MERDVQRDVETIRKICNNTSVLPVPTYYEAFIHEWVHKTRAGSKTLPMPWQILLDDQGTRTLDLDIACKLYTPRLNYLGNFLTHVCVHGQCITEAFIIFKDDETGHVSYPLLLTDSPIYGPCIDEALNVPWINVEFRFNDDARIIHFENTTNFKDVAACCGICRGDVVSPTSSVSVNREGQTFPSEQTARYVWPRTHERALTLFRSPAGYPDRKWP